MVSDIILDANTVKITADTQIIAEAELSTENLIVGGKLTVLDQLVGANSFFDYVRATKIEAKDILFYVPEYVPPRPKSGTTGGRFPTAPAHYESLLERIDNLEARIRALESPVT